MIVPVVGTPKCGRRCHYYAESKEPDWHREDRNQGDEQRKCVKIGLVPWRTVDVDDVRDDCGMGGAAELNTAEASSCSYYSHRVSSSQP